jgi:hypothetical protein
MVNTLGVLLGINLDGNDVDEKMDVDPSPASPSKSTNRPATPPPDPDVSLSPEQKEVSLHETLKHSLIVLPCPGAHIY